MILAVRDRAKKGRPWEGEAARRENEKDLNEKGWNEEQQSIKSGDQESVWTVM